MNQRIVGIDFGTSTTLIADRHVDGEPTVLPIGRTTSWMPSVVGVNDSGDLVAGEAALELNPERIVRSIKRHLTDGAKSLNIAGSDYLIQDLIVAILREALARATKVRPQLLDGNKVFVGCPALWSGSQRRILADAFAAVNIDIDIADIVDEPVAAGLFWGHSKWLESGHRPSGKTLIFDAGGGTLDVALMEIQGESSPSFTILAAEGRAESGDALDASIVDFLLPNLVGLANPNRAAALLGLRATALKERLSDSATVSVDLGGDYSTTLTMSRHELDGAFTPQMNRARSLVTSAVRSSLLRIDQPLSPVEIRQISFDELSKDILHVALVGGLSQVPLVHERLHELFPGANIELVSKPQESVAAGLTYGDRIIQLNLPRPPVNFTIDFKQQNGQPLGVEFDGWAAGAALAYNAFTPLYNFTQVALGEFNLGHTYEIPYPRGHHGPLIVTLRCEAPDRAGTRLIFRLPEGVADGVRVSHTEHRKARFRLMTNGDLSLSGSKGEFLRFKVQTWPSLRGPKHDWAREIRMSQSDARSSPDLDFENWRTK